MSCQHETHGKDRYTGSGRANQLQRACYHNWKMNARERNSNTKDWTP
jgi:hypothetical protein